MTGPLTSHNFCPAYRAVRRVVASGDMGKHILERRTTRGASDGVPGRVFPMLDRDARRLTAFF